MKTTLLLLMTIMTLSSNLLSQTDNIWVRIPNYENKKQIVSNLLQDQGVVSIEKAVPASRTPHLQELYQINCNCDVNDLLVTISKRHDVFINPEIGPKYETLGLPNDYNLSVPYDYALNLINAEGAWSFTEGDSSVVIGISDAGYYMNNMELFPKVVSSNLNFNMTNPIHGTAVATTAAGHTNNAFGKSSIGFKSSLDLRPMNYNGLLESSYAGAKVINASWAAGCYFSQYGQDVINEIYNNGSIVVAAAGNGTTCSGAGNYVYPASYEHVISVTSIGSSNNHERIFGNILSTHQHNDKVDLCAPGYDVYVTTTNGTFMTANGSSFASPYVAGTIGLMLSVNPCLSFEQIEHILKESADTIVYEVNPQYLGGLGAGRLDAAKAVEMAMNTKTFNVIVTKSVDCETFSTHLFTSEFYGEAPYTIEWSNGTTGPLCVANVPGIYSVSIQDSEGCRFYEEIEVEPYQEITIESSKHDVTCYGRSNGSIQLDVTGGKPGYSYLWYNNDTTSYLNDLPAGTYVVLVTDANNCSNIHEVTIDQPNPLQTSITANNSIIDLTVEGGSQPYTFEWYSPYEVANTEDITNPLPGFYEVLITDAYGCQASDYAYVANNSLGLTDNTSDEFEIYPNPSNGEVTIQKNSEFDLMITTTSGQQVVVNKTFTNKASITNLANGVYLVTVDNQTKKLIVNK